jgi:hypothetical protein
MNIKKLISLVVFIGAVFSAYTVKSQYLLNDITGAPVTVFNYEDVHGTPFLIDGWSAGTIKLSNGNTYKDNLFLKYDIKDDILYFKGTKDETLTFVDPVVEFAIVVNQNEQHYKNGYNFTKEYSDKSFFEVLADGAVQLLKKTKKVILESKLYNSATTDKSFNDVNEYYIVSSGKVTLIKKDKKSVFTALGNKQSELENYIKTNNLNIKNDKDLAKVIAFYNSL